MNLPEPFYGTLADVIEYQWRTDVAMCTEHLMHNGEPIGICLLRAVDDDQVAGIQIWGAKKFLAKCGFERVGEDEQQKEQPNEPS